jgi:hypothetical protein
MKVKLYCSYRDGCDGSFTIKFHSTRQRALDCLQTTEEKLDEGNFYDDGAVEEVEIEVDENGKIMKEVSFSIG